MSLLHRRSRKSKHRRAGRKAPKVRSKCLKACPRNIRVKCRVTNAAGDKTCNINVPGFYKAKGVSSAETGKKIASIKHMLRAKNCADPKVHSN